MKIRLKKHKKQKPISLYSKLTGISRQVIHIFVAEILGTVDHGLGLKAPNSASVGLHRPVTSVTLTARIFYRWQRLHSAFIHYDHMDNGDVLSLPSRSRIFPHTIVHQRWHKRTKLHGY